ncbi:hypothetical protein [Streptomyces sp. NPDC088350]|uniref:hypothetical protein n=1 Tax=Streptomyces sp. NPDC088350 TaxID=3365854 RepID=UPI0037FA0595
MSTVQPYATSDRWKFSSLASGHERTVQLALEWEPDGSSMSDDFTVEEANAAELWHIWVDRYGNRYHLDSPEVYAPWHVPVSWYVCSVGGGGTFEAAPHQSLPDDFPLREDFLTRYTHPLHARSSVPVNWLRLPVLDHGWNATQADKGGFIQEVTGWKPSPLLPAMDVRQVAKAAGAYVP